MNARDPLALALSALAERAARAETRERELEAELAGVRAERAHAQGAAEHIRGLTGVEQPVAVVVADGTRENAERIRKSGPRVPTMLSGMDAIAVALKRSPVALTLTELTDAVKELGWHPETDNPERAVRAAGNRLRKKDTDFDYYSRRWLYRPLHAGHLPPRLGGVGEFIDGESDGP